MGINQYVYMKKKSDNLLKTCYFDLHVPLAFSKSFVNGMECIDMVMSPSSKPCQLTR